MITKVRLATTTSPMTVVGSLELPAGSGGAAQVLLDESRGFGIVSTGATPTRYVKFAVDATAAPPVQLDTLDLQPGENSFFLGDYDRVNGIAYFISFINSPATVAKISRGIGNHAYGARRRDSV